MTTYKQFLTFRDPLFDVQTIVLEEEYMAVMGLKLMPGNETCVMEEVRDMVVKAESDHYDGVLGFLAFEGEKQNYILHVYRRLVVEGGLNQYETELPGEHFFLGMGYEIWNVQPFQCTIYITFSAQIYIYIYRFKSTITTSKMLQSTIFKCLLFIKIVDKINCKYMKWFPEKIELENIT